LEKNFSKTINNTMRDKDAQLIFESYLNSKKDVVLEADGSEKSGWEQAKDWAIFAGKVLDPTGISSYPDVIASFKKYEEDQSVLNFGILLLNGFSALPNLGLLAAGVGGIGWGALKAAAKAAVKSGAKKEIGPIASKILNAIKGSKELQYAFSKMTDSLVKNGSITKKGANSIMMTLKQGGVSTEIQRKGLEKALSSTGKSEFKQAGKEYFEKEAPSLAKGLSIDSGKGQIAQKVIRAGREGFASDSELEYPKFLPQGIVTTKEDQKGPTKNAAATGKYPVGKRIKAGESTPQKTEQSPVATKSKSKFALENL
jgi:hypothetical protein